MTRGVAYTSTFVPNGGRQVLFQVCWVGSLVVRATDLRLPWHAGRVHPSSMHPLGHPRPPQASSLSPWSPCFRHGISRRRGRSSLLAGTATRLPRALVIIPSRLPMRPGPMVWGLHLDAGWNCLRRATQDPRCDHLISCQPGI